MALQSNTSIFIAGKEITAFKRLMLQQQIDAHHLMELVCRMDVLEDLTQDLAASSKNFLGEVITLEIGSYIEFGSYEPLNFKGIVTQVRTVKGHEASEGDSVVITAQSPTFLADDGPHYDSYNDVSLSEIIEMTFKYYDGSKLAMLVQPRDDKTLHYSVQHNESAYDYGSRLAAQYGEWFYYNGTQLVFGKPATEELILTYGFDLKEYNINLIPQSHNYKYYSNDYLLDEVHEKDSKEVTAGANSYNGFVSDKSKAIFSKETKVWHNGYNDPSAKQRLDTSIELQKKAIEIQQVKLNGVSDNPGVKLGSLIAIEGASYRVIKVIHTNQENGDYLNRFEAVTAAFDAYPNTNIQAFPRSETQTAVVMENADPDGLGRIKVQFSWQKPLGNVTPWIRMVTPHAGGDKGFHFIPEVGEEVLIGFEGGNAERPYVMGSLYNGNGKAGAFQNADNDVKAIRTRSGHTIELNDSKGSEFITITDKNQNLITIDTANNNMIITALEKMTINAKNLEMNIGENMDINVGVNKNEKIGQNYNLNSSNSVESVKQSKSIDVGALYNQYSAAANIIATAGDMMIHSKGVSTFQGNADVKISKG